jgi:hypothetical protein
MNPRTPDQWQQAVDLAEGALLFHSARLCGLVAGGPKINVRRCRKVIQKGRGRGVFPTPAAAEKFVADLLGRP